MIGTLARTMGVGVGGFLQAHRALDAVDPADRTQAYLALRAVLCSSRADWERFDTAWALVAPPSSQSASNQIEDELLRSVLPRVAVPPSRTPTVADNRPPARVPAAYAAQELLLHKDFIDYSDAERRAARTVMQTIARRGPQRKSRRLRSPRARRGHVLDQRATLRTSMRHGGEPIDRRWRDPSTRPRPVILIIDVSGSMAPYARMLLQYAQACVAARRRVEAYAFGTRLTRITRELAGRDPDHALARATSAVVDLGGGTRIGASLATLNREHGRRLGRGALVVILSDGWDRGEPELLEREMARLRRCAHKVVWLNPLAADSRYEPLTRGMRAALPHTDHLLPGNSLASLAALAGLMEELDP